MAVAALGISGRELAVLRLMTEEVPMPWDWPVEVNQLEAAAFCRWQAAQTGLPVQLPSEAEWMLLREQLAGAGVTNA